MTGDSRGNDLQEFARQLHPVVEVLAGLDLADPGAAQALLDRQLPVDGALIAAIRTTAFAGAKAGWLLTSERGGVRFGRVAKELSGFSVDAVWSNAAGPKHHHPQGEINLLFAADGVPRFDGHGPGWAVYAPGSVHVPGVVGGTMLMLYFLPGGAIEWVKA